MHALSNVETLTQDQMEHYLAVLSVQRALQHELSQTEFLSVLHQQHTTRISFSTMSYHEGTELELYKPDQPMNAFTLQDAYERILIARKGGTCASLNKLFASLLKTLGYEVFAHKAKAMWGLDHKRPAAHRFSTVKIDNNIYLIDIGFGGPGPKDILLLYRNGKLVTDAQGEGFFQYKFSIDEENELVLQYFTKKIWRNVYAFEVQTTYSEEEYAVQSPTVNNGIAHFRTQTFFATRATQRGRIQQKDSTFSYSYEQDGNHHEETVTVSPQASLPIFLDTMDKFFGLLHTGPFKTKGRTFTTEVDEQAVEKLHAIKTKIDI